MYEEFETHIEVESCLQAYTSCFYPQCNQQGVSPPCKKKDRKMTEENNL